MDAGGEGVGEQLSFSRSRDENFSRVVVIMRMRVFNFALDLIRFVPTEGDEQKRRTRSKNTCNR